MNDNTVLNTVIKWRFCSTDCTIVSKALASLSSCNFLLSNSSVSCLILKQLDSLTMRNYLET